MIRFPINEATANNAASLSKLKGYINQIPGHWAIIAMFGTSTTGGHGNGLPNGLAAMGAAWKNINAVFSSYPNVYYEVFNEPFGYADNTQSDWSHYVSDMRTIISDGGLPTGRCILDGLGYASDINHVVSGGRRETISLVSPRDLPWKLISREMVTGMAYLLRGEDGISGGQHHGPAAADPGRPHFHLVQAQHAAAAGT